MESDKKVSEKLRQLRRTRGLTVDNLAKKMGENSQKVGRIERGMTGLTLDYLVKVSKALDTPLESFLEENQNDYQKDKNSTTHLLNTIIILVEEHTQTFSLKTSKKATIISKMYELASKFPEENRKEFVNGLLEFMLYLKQDEIE